MQQQELIGLALFAVALADTAVGQLFVAPRVKDENKRTIVRVAFVGSGLCIAGLGYAIHQGLITL